MSLIDDFKTACVPLTCVETPDGEGGRVSVWTEGVEFQAAITFDSSVNARAAAKQGVTSLYTVTVDKTVTLNFGDVFKRTSDNKTFRVTSDGDDIVTPTGASFSFRQITAEEWSVPT